jgi:hypothetical protein
LLTTDPALLRLNNKQNIKQNPALDDDTAHFVATAATAVHALHGATRSLDAERGIAAWMLA